LSNLLAAHVRAMQVDESKQVVQVASVTDMAEGFWQ
jgi:hypothetical protein